MRGHSQENGVLAVIAGAIAAGNPLATNAAVERHDAEALG
jgi:hypothetical protein